jgi:hypothetical protein
MQLEVLVELRGFSGVEVTIVKNVIDGILFRSTWLCRQIILCNNTLFNTSCSFRIHFGIDDI